MPVIGSLLQDRYRLDAELGRGGMGTVYRGYDTVLARSVAVKILTGSHFGPEGRARLLSEARAVARLNHPNIVSVYDAGNAEAMTPDGSLLPFIVMELLEGESLYERKPDSLDEIIAIACQICAALEHAHAQGIIHRDLKPENVLVTPDGTAKLMDFGLARSEASRITGEGTIIGTAYYLAPEQALGKEIDGRADLYALGVMLYELTTGQLPFTGDDLFTIVSQHLHAAVVPPSTHRPDLPPALEAVILKLLAKEPAERFASAGAVAQALSGDGPGEWQPGPTRPSNNLPVQLSTFIGREREIEKVKELLSSARLVTLTGAGGSGKTRLALQVAGELLASCSDGAWLIELASLSEADFVPQAAISALDIRAQPGRHPLEILTNYLHSRQALLILDNCEHLIDACATLAETLLRSCPQLRILATSREALGITGESAWMVPPLSVPDPARLPPSGEALISTLAQFEAVQLFLDRTAAVQPGFRLTPQNAMAVAKICHHLDGIPLAIELAAARMRALGIAQIAARLDDRFNLLTVGSRTALPQHQTLRATIDWSYELLSLAERTMLGRLSVFVHGWTLAAAEEVCGGDEAIQKAQVLDLLTRLVDKSLAIVEEREKGVRYHLLETIRQYAREKLAEQEAPERIRQRHLHFFVRLAEAAESKLCSAEQIIWLDQLESEHDNLRAALEWSLKHGETEMSLRLAGSLWRFWYLRGYWREGREWLQRTLAQEDRQPATPARIKALYGAGWLADESGREGPLYEESLALARQVNDDWAAAFCLRGLGALASNQGRREEALALLEESLALFQKTEEKWGVALALFNQGWVVFEQSNYARADALWEESLRLFRQKGDRWGMAVSLGALGLIGRLQGNYKRATAQSKESLELFRELGDKAGIAQSLFRLAHVALRRDEFAQAATLFGEAMDLQKELGYTTMVAYAFNMLGLIACYQGEFEQAGQMLEKSLSLLREADGERGIASVRDIMALVTYYQGGINRAGSLWQECLDLFRNEADRDGVASALNGLGRVAQAQGNFQEAAALLQESLEIRRELGEKQNLAITLNSLGRLLLAAQGDYLQAAALLRESLGLRQEMGSKRGIAETLEGLAAVAIVQEEAEQGAKWLGAAAALREAIGAPVPPVERADYERTLTTTQATLSEETFRQLWSEGQTIVESGDWRLGIQ